MKIVHQGLAAFLLSGAGLAHAVPHYSVTAIAPAGSGSYGINNAGIVVGYSGSQSGFIYDHGSYSTHTGLGNKSARFYDINESGVAVGVTYAAPEARGLRYDSATGVTTEYAPPGGYSSAQLLSINNAGTVAGFYGGADTRAFIDSGSGPQQPAPLVASVALDINNSGTAVGYIRTDGVSHAVVYENNGYSLVGNFAGGSGAYAINDSGWIGGYYEAGSDNGAFLRNAQGNMFLFSQPSRDIYLQDINSAGVAVGRNWISSSPDSFGYLFLDGAAVDLNTRLLNRGDWTIVDAAAINNSGSIAATGCHQTTGLCQAVLLEVSPVPEPATWAMLLAGLAVTGYGARRRANTGA